MKTDDFSLRDNAEVDEDPPYMVIKTKDNPKDNDKSEITSSQQRVSIPGRGDAFSMGLQLGEEYEKKKQKLQQELRLDFRMYVSKKTDLKSYQPSTQPESLSLLFDERKSIKDKLRDERKKEYNLFLKEQAGLKSAVSKRQSRISYKSSPSGDNTDTVSRSGAPSPVLVPDHQHASDGFHDDQPPTARRGPYALTEEDAGGTTPVRRRRQWEKGREKRESPVVVVLRVEDYEKRRPTRKPRRQRRRRRRQGRRGRAGYSSEEDEEEEEELTSSHEEEEMERGWKGRPRSKQEAPPVALHQDNRSRGILKPHSATANINRRATDTTAMRSAERARSATTRPQAEVATGLAIGAVEGSQASQKKKELYRLELLEQMAEQRRNKRREKELEMRMAVDPEKKPDRNAQVGAANLPYGSLGRGPPRGDQRMTPGADATENTPPPGKPWVAFSIPGSGPPRGMQTSGAVDPQLPPSTEDFHRTMSRALGEMAAPRPVGPWPPIPPALTDTYRTPYDEAYLYYGARNPLDMALHHYNPPVGGGAGGGGGGEGGGYQLVGGFSPPLGTPQKTGASSQQVPVSPAVLGVLPEERPGQTRENALSYGEALRQQIKESEECRTREREEKDRYHAKLEEEMKAYDPWGRGGAGAPIRDKGGNLISDLKKMRRTNDNAYITSEGGDRKEVETSENAASPKTEDAAFDQSEHQRPGALAGMAPHFACSKVFPEEPAPRKLLEQKDYRHFLELQMEEKRQKQAEEREEARLKEEKLERRLVEEQARMGREFQQEQEKKRREREERSRSNAVMMLQAEERRQAERRREEEQESERENRVLSRRERERQEGVVHRGMSPLIPTLQRRLGRQTAPPGPPTPGRPPSSSASTTQSERSTPAPYSPPVPARRNQLRARGGPTPPEDRREVIRELSVLRRHLSAERRRVERLAQREETPAPPPRPPRYRKAPETEVLEVVRRAGRAPSAGARVTMQNIRDFNRLRDRDTASRAEVRYVYPDPPRDEVSLDIQQQALLRMQQRRTGPPGGGDGLVDPLRQLHPPRKPREETKALLASDSAFLDCYGADQSPEPPQRTRTPPPPPPSGGRRGRTPSDRAEWGQKSTTPLPADPPPAGASPSEEQTPPRRRSSPPRRAASQGELPGSPVEEEAGRARSQAPSRDSLVSENMRRIQARNQQRLRQLDRLGLDPELLSEVTSDGNDGGSTPLTARSCVSRETVATEPWLRPGTSELVKRPTRRDTEHQGGGGGGGAGAQDQEWLDGPNTYHG